MLTKKQAEISIWGPLIIYFFVVSQILGRHWESVGLSSKMEHSVIVVAPGNSSLNYMITFIIPKNLNFSRINSFRLDILLARKVLRLVITNFKNKHSSTPKL